MKKIIAFLLIVSCVFLFSCDRGKDDVDGSTLSTWVYINDTEYTVEIASSHQNVTVEPMKSHSFDLDRLGGNGKTRERDYQSPFHGGAKITYNGKEYMITDGVTKRENYIAERIASNNFKFTYTFTAENLPKE